MKTTLETLLSDLTSFQEATGLSDYRIGMSIANDHKLMQRLRSGKDVTTSTADKAYEYMRSYGAAA